MISQTGTYALKATLHLATRKDDRPVAAVAMARDLDIPADYLAKILARLKASGVLESVRGAHGGYRLAENAGELTVARVVEPFEDHRQRGICLLGNRPCDPARPCAAHARWSAWTGAAQDQLQATTVADLLRPESRSKTQSELR